MSVFFIGEIGINHNGDVEAAKRMIDMAVDCKCDAVKFQKRTVEIVYSKEYLDSPRKSPWGATQRAQKEGLEFGKVEYDIIDHYCQEKGIDWFWSSWDPHSHALLRQYGCKYNKVASAMLTHDPLVKMIAADGKHTFISTGMSTYAQIDHVVEIFRHYRCPFTLMHCVSQYPCRDIECNINMIPELKKRYKCRVGYSGHETGLLPSLLAVAVGAEVLERHITFDRAAYGSDQSASLEKHGLEVLVRDARLVKQTLGDGVKRITDGERATEKALRYFREG